MLGILIALALSWILLYLFEKRTILSLGFLPVKKRSREFIIGFLITALLCAGTEGLEILIRESKVQVNDDFSFRMIWEMFYWDFKSVVTEELVFRGALLFILIEKLGVKKGILISAVAFGIYHWFSFGIIGNLIPMIVVFIGTGLMGYAWALAFAKTGSVFMPIGLHLGWNFTFNSVFSNGPLGRGILIAEGGEAISDFFSLVGLWVVPAIVLLIVKFKVPYENQVSRSLELPPVV